MPTDVGIKHATSIYATLVLQKVICTDLHGSIKSEKGRKIKVEHKSYLDMFERREVGLDGLSFR